MHHSSYYRVKRFVEICLANKVNDKLSILDFGSQVIGADLSYKSLFNCPNWTYTGVDLCVGNNVDFVLKDKYNWSEIADNSVDVFVSGQVFEHIEFIWLTIAEVGRILKPGGLTCILAPSAVGMIHRFPLDCWRIQVDGWLALAKHAKLKPIVCQTNWEALPAWRDGSYIWDDCILIATKE